MTQQEPNARLSGSADPNENRSANLAELEAEIDQTRHAISGDLRTLGERLDPAHLKEEAKEVMVEAKNVAVETLHEAKTVATDTYREVKEDAMNTVSEKVDQFRDNVRVAERETVDFLRENAVPLALIGAGVGWFFATRRNRERRWEGDYRARGDGPWRYPPEGERQRIDEPQDRSSRIKGSAREAAARARGRAEQWTDSAGQQVQGAADKVRHFAEREFDHASSAARSAEQRLTETAHRARDFAGREIREMRDYSRQMTDTHPLALGLAAIAAGIGVGLLLPSTAPEQRLLGETKERLVDDAKQAAQQLGSTAKQAAREVKDSLTGAPS